MIRCVTLEILERAGRRVAGDKDVVVCQPSGLYVDSMTAPNEIWEPHNYSPHLLPTDGKEREEVLN